MRRASGPSCRTRRSRREGLGRAKRAVLVEHGPEHWHRGVVWRAPTHTLDCRRKVDRGHRMVPDAHFGAHKACLRVQRGKVFLGGLDKRGVVHPTCTGEYHPASGAVGVNLRLKIGSFDQLDVLRGPRMVRPSCWPNRRVSGQRHVVE